MRGTRKILFLKGKKKKRQTRHTLKYSQTQSRKS